MSLFAAVFNDKPFSCAYFAIFAAFSYPIMGESAVTVINEFQDIRQFSRFGLIPTTQLSANEITARLKDVLTAENYRL